MDWQREVDELHELFEAWFLGTASSLERFEATMAPSFTMVGPDGRVSGREEIVQMVRDGHGHTSSLRIEISDHRLIASTDELVVASYVETHHLTDRRNDRRTTVLFEVRPDAPCGVRWLHAQETWLG